MLTKAVFLVLIRSYEPESERPPGTDSRTAAEGREWGLVARACIALLLPPLLSSFATSATQRPPARMQSGNDTTATVGVP